MRGRYILKKIQSRKVKLSILLILAIVLQMAGPTLIDMVSADKGGLEQAEVEIEKIAEVYEEEDKVVDGEEATDDEEIIDEDETALEEENPQEEPEEEEAGEDEEEEEAKPEKKSGLAGLFGVKPMAEGGEEDSFYDIKPEDDTSITYKVDVRYQDNTNYDYHKIAQGEEIDLSTVFQFEYLVKFAIGDDVTFNGSNNTKTFDISGLNLADLNLKQTSGDIDFTMKDTDTDVTETIVGGSYIIDANKLTITLDPEALTGYKARKGYVQLNFNVQTVNEELELVEEIKIDGLGDKTFYIKRHNEKAKLISKSGNYNEKDDLIYWEIDVNTALSSLTNASVVDTIPKGLTVTKVEIIDLKVTNKNITEDGSWDEIYFNSDPDSSQNDGEENELNLDLSSYDLDRKAKRIKVTTSIASDKIGYQNFENNVDLYGNGKKEPLERDDANVQIENRIAGISKSNSWNSETNTISWTIEFRGDGKNYDLVDKFTLPPGVKLLLIDDSVKLDGSPYNGTVNKDEINNGNITFKDVPSKETGTSKLTFDTKVIFEGNDNKINENQTYNITNKATYNGLSAESSISKSRGSVMEKTNGTIYGKDGKTYIEWNININQKNEKWKDVKITEKLPADFKFVSASIVDEQIDSSKITGTDQNKEIDLGEIDGPTTVTIIAVLEEGKTLPDKIVNKATISYKYNYDGDGIIGGGVNSGDYSEEVEGENTKQQFDNTLSKSGSINYDDSTVTWTVAYKTLNDNVEGLIFEDNLNIEGSEEHKFTNASDFKLILNGNDVKLESITDKDSDNDMEKSTIFIDENNKYFRIRLANNLGNTEYNSITLTYKTKFDLKNMTDVDFNHELKNEIKRTDGDREEKAPASVSIEKWISKNGKKSVEYKDGVYKWTVELNPKGKEIPSETKIKDVLSTEGSGAYQKYMKNSIKIVKASLGEDRLTPVDPEEEIKFTSSIEDKTITTEKSETVTYNEGMTITLNEKVTSPFIITYETEAVGLRSIEYKNKVEIDIDGYLPHTAKKSHEIKTSDYITKELLNGRPLSGNYAVVKGDILEWKIVVNAIEAEIYDFQLTDSMEDGLIFIEDSLKINEGSYSEAGFGFNKLDGKEGFIITKNLVDEKLTITYETLVYSKNAELEDISNNVEINGFESFTKVIEDNSFRIIPRSQAGGVGVSGSDKYYDLVVQKKKVSTNNQLENLEDTVKFNLITVTTIKGEEYTTSEELLTNSNGKLEIKGLQKTNDSDPITIKYYLEEVEAPDGYILLDEKMEINFDDAKNNVIELPIVNIEKTEVSGEKFWLDNDNVDEDRPESITVKLLSKLKGSDVEPEPVLDDEDEQVSKEVNPDDDGNWKYTFENLPKHKYIEGEDGEECQYVEIEYSVEELLEGYEGKYQATIDGFDITNLRIGKTKVEGSKTWLDDENIDKDRPESIEVKLLQNGEEINSKAVSSEEDWAYKFDDLDKYDDQGVEYDYTIEEDVPEGYETIYSDDSYDITNFRVGKTEVVGSKTWLDSNSKNRPEYIEVNLLQNGEKIYSKTVGSEDDWKYEFMALEKYDNQGVEYEYTIEEEAVEGYSTSYKKTEDGFDITNLRVGNTQITGKKFWINGPVEKPTIELQLFRNGEKFGDPVELKNGESEYTWTNLSKFDSNGAEYSYTVDEVETPENYGKSISEDGLTITNTYESPITDIVGRKVWKYAPDVKPTIQLQLYRNGEVLEGEEYLVTLDDGIYEYAWKDMPITDENGVIYEYSVDEVEAPENYEKTISEDGLTVTNKYIDPEEPGFEKDIEGNTSLQVDKYDQVFTYNVKTDFPKDISGYESLLIMDELEDVLEVKSAQVYLDGKRSLELEKYLVVDGNMVYLSLDYNEGFDFSLVAGRTVTIVIKSQIIEGSDLSKYEDKSIPNLAFYRLNDSEALVQSEKVIVRPPEEPEIPETPDEPKDPEKPEDPNKPDLPKTGSDSVLFTLFYVIGFIVLIGGFLLLKKSKKA